MNYVLKNEYIYILNSKEGEFTPDDFNPEKYEFSEGDYRISIKYVRKKLKLFKEII